MQAEHRRPLLAFVAVLCLAGLILGQALGRPGPVVRERVAQAQAATQDSPRLLLGDRLSERPQPTAPRSEAPPSGDLPDDLAGDLGVPETFVTADFVQLDVSTGARTSVTTAAGVGDSSTATVRTAAVRTPTPASQRLATTGPVTVAASVFAAARSTPQTGAGMVATNPGPVTSGKGNPAKPRTAKHGKAKPGKAKPGQARTVRSTLTAPTPAVVAPRPHAPRAHRTDHTERPQRADHAGRQGRSHHVSKSTKHVKHSKSSKPSKGSRGRGR